MRSIRSTPSLHSPWPGTTSVAPAPQTPAPANPLHGTTFLAAFYLLGLHALLSLHPLVHDATPALSLWLQPPGLLHHNASSDRASHWRLSSLHPTEQLGGRPRAGCGAPGHVGPRGRRRQREAEAAGAKQDRRLLRPQPRLIREDQEECPARHRRGGRQEPPEKCGAFTAHFSLSSSSCSSSS